MTCLVFPLKLIYMLNSLSDSCFIIAIRILSITSVQSFIKIQIAA